MFGGGAEGCKAAEVGQIAVQNQACPLVLVGTTRTHPPTYLHVVEAARQGRGQTGKGGDESENQHGWEQWLRFNSTSLTEHSGHAEPAAPASKPPPIAMRIWKSVPAPLPAATADDGHAFVPQRRQRLTHADVQLQDGEAHEKL